MERIQNAIDELVDKLKAKGYNTASFQTNCDYSNSLKESINRYLEESLLGNEPGLSNGIELRTYLRWEGTGRPYVEAYMHVRYSETGVFDITQMDVYHKHLGNTLKKNELKGISTDSVPHLRDAVALVQGQKLRERRNLKI